MDFVLSPVKNLTRAHSNNRKRKIDTPRLMAYEIFQEVIRKEGYSNLLLNQRLSKSNLDTRDKSFVTELVYGSIRQLGRNDYIAARFSAKEWSQVDSGIVDVVRIGLYQLFDMRVPLHAAVSSSVDLAKAILGESKASYVNAIMRKISTIPLDGHLVEVSDDSTTSLQTQGSVGQPSLSSSMVKDLPPGLVSPSPAPGLSP